MIALFALLVLVSSSSQTRVRIMLLGLGLTCWEPPLSSLDCIGLKPLARKSAQRQARISRAIPWQLFMRRATFSPGSMTWIPEGLARRARVLFLM